MYLFFLVFIRNLKSFIKKRSVRFGYDYRRSLLVAKEGELRRFHPNITRGMWNYQNGIKIRGSHIFKSYMLHNISFSTILFYNKTK